MIKTVYNALKRKFNLPRRSGVQQHSTRNISTSTVLFTTHFSFAAINAFIAGGKSLSIRIKAFIIYCPSRLFEYLVTQKGIKIVMLTSINLFAIFVFMILFSARDFRNRFAFQVNGLGHYNNLFPKFIVDM
jgi:hypothetical protein